MIEMTTANPGIALPCCSGCSEGTPAHRTFTAVVDRGGELTRPILPVAESPTQALLRSRLQAIVDVIFDGLRAQVGTCAAWLEIACSESGREGETVGAARFGTAIDALIDYLSTDPQALDPEPAQVLIARTVEVIVGLKAAMGFVAHRSKEIQRVGSGSVTNSAASKAPSQNHRVMSRTPALKAAPCDPLADGLARLAALFTKTTADVGTHDTKGGTILRSPSVKRVAA
ncbi:MAG: hypothetical protein IV100_25060 [Myxococcales bacterium]|nr:hypothetical protein [Myxococcales bacterium]